MIIKEGIKTVSLHVWVLLQLETGSQPRERRHPARQGELKRGEGFFRRKRGGGAGLSQIGKLTCQSLQGIAAQNTRAFWRERRQKP